MFWKWAHNYPKTFQNISNTVSFPVYWVGRFIFMNSLFNYYGCTLMIYSWEHNMIFYKYLNYIPNAVTLLVTIALMVTNVGQKAPKKPEETKKDK